MVASHPRNQFDRTVREEDGAGPALDGRVKIAPLRHLDSYEIVEQVKRFVASSFVYFSLSKMNVIAST